MTTECDTYTWCGTDLMGRKVDRPTVFFCEYIILITSKIVTVNNE